MFFKELHESLLQMIWEGSNRVRKGRLCTVPRNKTII